MCPTKKKVKTCVQSQTISTSTYCISFTFADKDFGDAKISNFDNHLVLVQKNILCLQVSVQDEFVVNVVQGQQNLNKEMKDCVFV